MVSGIVSNLKGFGLDKKKWVNDKFFGIFIFILYLFEFYFFIVVEEELKILGSYFFVSYFF